MSLKKKVLSWFSPNFCSRGRILLFFLAKDAKDTKGKFTFLFKMLDTDIPSCWRGRKISGYIYNTNKFETFGLCERYIFHGFRN